jgi:GMP synthase (glutamine-hydrolysing)
MDRLRICLLNASYEAADTRRNFRRELDADLVEYHTPEGDIPPLETAIAFDEFDACVVTGSRASVYWDEAWIDDASEWLVEAVATGMPCLGVCYGHQLLAEVLGGEVAAMSEYEIGYRSVTRTGDSRLFEELDREFTVFETHSDRVTQLPPGAEPIAENEYGIQGFRTGDVFGVQFHPEYDRPTARTVTRGKDELSEERIEAVLAGLTDENYAAACETKQLFENFTEFVRERRAASPRAATAIDD